MGLFVFILNQGTYCFIGMHDKDINMCRYEKGMSSTKIEFIKNMTKLKGLKYEDSQNNIEVNKHYGYGRSLAITGYVEDETTIKWLKDVINWKCDTFYKFYNFIRKNYNLQYEDINMICEKMLIDGEFKKMLEVMGMMEHKDEVI